MEERGEREGGIKEKLIKRGEEVEGKEKKKRRQ